MPEKDNRVTIGGICLERKSGGITHASPIVQFSGTDEQLQELWHFLESNTAIKKAMEDCRCIVAAELIGWGDQRATTPAAVK